MIYGPKNDGTYVVEFKDGRGRGPGDLDPKEGGSGDPAFPRADALQVVPLLDIKKPPRSMSVGG